MKYYFSNVLYVVLAGPYALCSPLPVSLFIFLALGGPPSSSSSSFTSNSCFTFSPPCCQASGVYHVLVGTIRVTTFFVDPDSFNSSSCMSLDLKVSKSSLGPLGYWPLNSVPCLYLLPPISSCHLVNSSLLLMKLTPLISY